MNTPQKIFFALVLAAIGQVAWFWGDLPVMMASHFDGAGRADGWSSRLVFFALMFGTMALSGGAFLGLPLLMRKIPAGAISLPHRDYWLSERLRAGTFRYIEAQMSWFGAVTQLLLVAIVQITIEANLAPDPGLPAGFMWVFWLYVAYTLVWTVTFVGHFARPGGRRRAS